ncbi:hypothetical protein ACFYZ4_36600 [Streptomyces sp. NPDC001513]|uniref:hypothetical protein n=1 Tax=Streptomyces sp. NPDC001513 TaxID=3364580 RepID=UPI0036B1FC88
MADRDRPRAPRPSRAQGLGCSQPPRPADVGDVVAVYSETPGVWTASQVTGIDAAAKCAAAEAELVAPECTRPLLEALRQALADLATTERRDGMAKAGSAATPS